MTDRQVRVSEGAGGQIHLLLPVWSDEVGNIGSSRRKSVTTTEGDKPPQQWEVISFNQFGTGAPVKWGPAKTIPPCREAPVQAGADPGRAIDTD
jgi:hypothetical protein